MTGGLETIFLRLAPTDIAFLKFVIESYEGVAVVRTLDRQAAVIVVLASADFRDVVRAILNDLRGRIDFEEIETPPEAADDWLLGRLWKEGAD
jgi:hypothetical protein